MIWRIKIVADGLAWRVRRACTIWLYERVRILVMKTDPKRLCNGWTETEVQTWYGGNLF